MSEVYELHAQVRENLGTGHSRRMRRLENKTPAVIYGGGEEPESIAIDHNKVLKAIKNEGFYSSILTLDVNGKKQKAVLKDIQRHPFKPKVVHMDFQRISAKEKLTMHVPIHFLGEDSAPGVKQGGIITHLENGADISCLPADLPEFLELDLSTLELDASLHLSDIKLPKGIELVDLMHENDKAVASIHLPRAAVEEEAPAAEAESEEKPAEPEEKS